MFQRVLNTLGGFSHAPEVIVVEDEEDMEQQTQADVKEDDPYEAEDSEALMSLPPPRQPPASWVSPSQGGLPSSSSSASSSSSSSPLAAAANRGRMAESIVNIKVVNHRTQYEVKWIGQRQTSWVHERDLPQQELDELLARYVQRQEEEAITRERDEALGVAQYVPRRGRRRTNNNNRAPVVRMREPQEPHFGRAVVMPPGVTDDTNIPTMDGYVYQRYMRFPPRFGLYWRTTNRQFAGPTPQDPNAKVTYSGLTRVLAACFYHDYDPKRASEKGQQEYQGPRMPMESHHSYHNKLTGMERGSLIDAEFTEVLTKLGESGARLHEFTDVNTKLPQHIDARAWLDLEGLRNTVHPYTLDLADVLVANGMVPVGSQLVVGDPTSRVATGLDVMCLSPAPGASTDARVLIEVKTGFDKYHDTPDGPANNMRMAPPFEDLLKTANNIHVLQIAFTAVFFEMTYPNNPVHGNFVVRLSKTETRCIAVPDDVMQRARTTGLEVIRKYRHNMLTRRMDSEAAAEAAVRAVTASAAGAGAAAPRRGRAAALQLRTPPRAARGSGAGVAAAADKRRSRAVARTGNDSLYAPRASRNFPISTRSSFSPRELRRLEGKVMILYRGMQAQTADAWVHFTLGAESPQHRNVFTLRQGRHRQDLRLDPQLYRNTEKVGGWFVAIPARSTADVRSLLK